MGASGVTIGISVLFCGTIECTAPTGSLRRPRHQFSLPVAHPMAYSFDSGLAPLEMMTS